jgi:hypothetical protein
MAQNYNVNPYYDDYDETKQFYRILFRPGRAVQARELTQLQTSLQKQIERFGQGIYKEGSIVVPGGQVVDNKYNYVKLTASYGANTSDTKISSLINETITGLTSNVKAIVVNSISSTSGGDPSTIYVKYTASQPYSGGSNTVFQAGELITTQSGNVTLQVAATTPTGVATAFSVSSGVIFTKGVFAYFDSQTLVAGKYALANNTIIGFQVTESTTTSSQDTSLLDPAVGASNYIAPGADRYKIALDLATRPVTFNANDDPNFIELIKIENGEVISQNLDPRYSILGDTFARRTYDESGNYIVKPYTLNIINHLKSSNVSSNGYYEAANGGDDNKLMTIIQPGKAYVRGYEVENIRTKYTIGNKAREYANVNNGVVSTTIGNYIYITGLFSIPDLSILPSVAFYDRYTATPGSSSGTAIGTGRIRGLEFSSGTPGTSTAVYKCWLFDISMTAGYVFERDVKQLLVGNSGYSTFTANISPTQIALSGSVSTTNGSNVITGAATLFTNEVTTNDFISINSISYRITSVTNAVSLVVDTAPTANQTGIIAYYDTAAYNETQYLAHLFEFPYSTIKTVDPTNIETSYDVKRSYARTLSSNTVTISAGTDETFDSIATSSYILVVKSGTNAGQYLNPTTFVTRAGGGTSVTINLAALSNSPANVSAYATADVALVGKLTKTNTAADKKTKTLVSGATIDYTDANTAQATVVSLGKADVYKLTSVMMSPDAFGTAFNTTGDVDITDRYELDNGQKLTYYGLGKVRLKAGSPKPTNPIRITFDYFTHGSGDYFSVNSYTGIAYKDIPTFTDNRKTYQLRDCLDFRPRINDNGTGFGGVGAVVNDFIDPASDVLTDYSYYLPRTDKIVLDKNGIFSIVEGISSLNPKEPNVSDDTMPLFVIKQKPYVFDITSDIEVTTIDNRRYTMRDIGRIENRVKNLEYYTTLNLLEKDTQSLQIQDSNGFDRFKNGFVVDNFAGHGVGDVYNRDYGVSIDYTKKELRPLSKTQFVPLQEINLTTPARTANNYVLTNDLITLPYTDVSYIKNEKASKTENINPFSVITWTGSIKLDPPSDIWFSEEELPMVAKNENGNYDQFGATSQSKGTYNAVWGNWRTNYYGSQRTDDRTGLDYAVSEGQDTKTNNDLVTNSALVPKMRSVKITFTAEGMKPKTRVNIFFDNINVTNYCNSINTNPIGANSALAAAATANSQNLITDETGKLTGEFHYLANLFNLPTGESTFVVTDSTAGGTDFETFAVAKFNSNGQLIKKPIPAAQVILEPPPTYVASAYVDEYVEPDPAPAPVPPTPDYLDVTYRYAFGRNPAPNEKQYWYDSFSKQVTNKGYASINALISASSVNGGAFVDVGAISPDLITIGDYNTAAADLYALTKQITDAGIRNNEQGKNGVNGITEIHLNNGGTKEVASDFTAKQITYAIAAINGAVPNATNTSNYWKGDAQSAVLTTVKAEPTAGYSYGANCLSAGGMDPLAQSFFINTPIYLSKLDVYFSSKDDTIPMRVQIRKMENGVPGSFILPSSEVVVYPTNINTSTDGSTATSISFESPVFLDSGEYAFVLLSDSINYRVWIAQVGEFDILTNTFISEQPYIGVLFKSQNASTWQADQFQDMKFNLYRAEFDTSVTGVVEFNVDDEYYDQISLGIDPFEVYANSNIMRVIHPAHGQVTGSSIKLNGFPLNGNLINSSANSNFFGINVSSLNAQTFTIDNVTLDSYTITLPSNVSNAITQTTRTGGASIQVSTDFAYDTYYPVISAVVPSGTTLVNKIKTTSSSTYGVDSAFTTIALDDVNFNSTKTLASNVNKQVAMSNTNPFIHRIEFSTSSSLLSPVIDTKQIGGVYARNLINNPTYGTENKVSANDIVTIANANNIIFTQVSGAQGLITLSGSQDKINATSIIKGTYINVTANNGVNAGQYRVIDVTDAGTNLSVYNVSAQNVSTNATATYTITNGRNFIAEEAAYDGSAYSKYITREIDFTNPSTSFKFYVDVAKPTNANIKFFYKISEVGDTVDLREKEYTEITGITVQASLGGEFNEVEKLVENLPQFDAIVFKIVFLSDDSSQIPKCKNLRLVALA